MKLPPLAEMRKALVAVIGGLAEMVSLGLLHGTAENVALVIIAAATAGGVFGVGNADPVKPKPQR